MANIMVNNQADLTAKLGTVKAGDTLLLAPGNYGLITIKSKNFVTPITIKSASATNPAKIEQLNITGSRGITISGIDLGSPLDASEVVNNCHNTAQITNSSYISFDKVHVYGSLDGNPTNDRDGLSFRGSNNISVTNSKFEQLARGVLVGTSQDVKIADNSFTYLSTDGIDFAQVQRVSVDGNTFSHFTPKPGDHPDAIQFWTSGTTAASTDISITNNQILMGGPVGTQGIFLRDELGTLPYERVTIDNNLVYINNGYNGIAVVGGKNVTVTDNTVVSQTSDTLKLRINLTGVAGATVANNVSDQFITSGSSNINVTNNLFFTDQPSASALVPNLSNGTLTSASDLIVSGYGYQIPIAMSSLTLPTRLAAAREPRQRTAPTAAMGFAPATLGEMLDNGNVASIPTKLAPIAANDGAILNGGRNMGMKYQFGLAVSPTLNGFG